MYNFLKKRFCCTCCLLMWSSTIIYAQPGKAKSGIQNPVLDKNFADPTIVKVKDKYYAYATNSSVDGKAMNIQVAVSTDLQHWMIEGDALPSKPSWGLKDFWAPHVLYDASLKKYVLFYSAESIDTTTGKCLGVAFADSPSGPFKDKGEPLIMGKGFVNIDPIALIDPATGKKFLYWGSGFEPIKMQEMSDDWKSFKPGTEARAVVWPGKEKEYDRLVEGAWVDLQDGKYYLYYSGDNCCGDKANYAVMIAKSDKATGPFIRLGEANHSGSSVILAKNDQWIAPGHNSIFRDEDGTIWIAYHAINKKEREKGRGERRVMCINKIIYKNGWPEVVKD